MTDEEIREALDESGECEDCDGGGTTGAGRYVCRCNNCGGTGFDQRAMLRAVQAVGQLLLNATERSR